MYKNTRLLIISIVLIWVGFLTNCFSQVVSSSCVLVCSATTVTQNDDKECPDKNLPLYKRKQYDFDFESQINKPAVLAQKFSSGSKKFAIVYFTRPPEEKRFGTGITDVYIFEKGKPLLELCWVIALVDHNIGPDKEFVGALVCQEVYPEMCYSDEYYKIDSKMPERKECYFLEYEIKLPDDVAENLVKLLTNDLEWKNETIIDYIEVNSNKLIPPKSKTIKVRTQEEEDEELERFIQEYGEYEESKKNKEK